jgi:hypothetical protein
MHAAVAPSHIGLTPSQDGLARQYIANTKVKRNRASDGNSNWEKMNYKRAVM